MIIGNIELYSPQVADDLDQESLIQQLYYPFGLQQKFESRLDQPIVEYLCDLDRFHSEYFTERNTWLKSRHTKCLVRYTSRPADEGHGGQFVLIVFFQTAQDAIAYKERWSPGGEVQNI